MIIKSMTATFGKLENAALELQPGLNVIAAPNEWGKSTWCAFLEAMLYGIDTRSRSTKTTLSEKEHFQPWSGRPMEGRIDLIHNGRSITIQRRTAGRVPLGSFAAFETETGLPIPELTAENCGILLLGVERSVYRRTGFIRLEELPVTEDEALRRRLNALVTTGDESGTADLLAGKLKELKRRCRYNRTGLIPQAEAELAECRRNQAELTRLHQRQENLTNALSRYERELAGLRNHAAALDAANLADARQAAEQARIRLEDCRRDCADLPSPEETENALSKGYALQQRLQELALAPEQKNKRKNTGISWKLLLFLGLFALVLALLGLGTWGYVIALGLLLGAAYCFARPAAPQDDSRDTLRREVLELTGDADLNAYLTRWQSVADRRDALHRAEQEARQAEQLLSRMPPARPFDADDLTLSREETHRRIETAQSQIQQLRFDLGKCRGELAAFDGFQNREDALTRRLAELRKTEAALELALATLEEAQLRLQRRFAPRIAAQAQELFSQLTGGRYEELTLDRDLSLSARAAGETTLRSPRWRSSGTADQLYLSVRLAAVQALIPEAPLVLDEALARFDPERQKNAIKVLEALPNQVILFTTHP